MLSEVKIVANLTLQEGLMTLTVDEIEGFYCCSITVKAHGYSSLLEMVVGRSRFPCPAEQFHWEMKVSMSA